MIDIKRFKDLVYQVIGSAMTVHSELRWGLLESVYQEALHLELMDRKIDNVREQEIQIHYKKHILEKYYKMDLVVGELIVELKSVSKISPAHRAQLCNYLRLTRKPLGLLINFGEKNLVGERWAYDEVSNECFLVDRNMDRVFDTDYDELLSVIQTDEENQKIIKD